MEELFTVKGWKVTREAAPLPDGRQKEAIRVYSADRAQIIAFTKPDTILVLREFRPFYQEYIWMLPSGRIDKETDMTEGARRELREETGFDADSFESLCNANHSDTFASTNRAFVARNLKKSPLPPDVDELIEVHEMPIEEALEKILTSPRIHMPSAFALFYYLRKNS